MTTIIITVISILVAATAALIVVFYGGFMYQSGGVAADADRYMNAGHNVMAAADRFRMDNRIDPPDVNALVEGGYLASFPFVDRSAMTATGGGLEFTIADVPADVCAKINETFARDPSDAGSGSMGCRTSGDKGVYYAET